MASKSMKPSAPARPAAITPEEKQAQILRALAAKREQFATSILFGMAHNPETSGSSPQEAVEWAVEAADCLMEKLYPISKQEEKTEK